LKAESTALGIHNPSFGTFEHLQKFPNRASESGSGQQSGSFSSCRVWGRQYDDTAFSSSERYVDPDQRMKF
jgi:hypothetical protein